MIPFFAGLVMICLVPTTGRSQDFKEHINKQYAAPEPSKKVLAIYNLNGSIRVEGYSGDKVIVDIDKKISADDNDDLELG